MRTGRQALAWDNKPLSGKRGEPARRMTFMLTDDDHDKLTAIAAARGVRLAAAIRLLINEETDRVASDSAPVANTD